MRKTLDELLEKNMLKNTLVVGIGGKARHGKNTLAEHMAEISGGKVFSFADALKVEVFNFLQAHRFVKESGEFTPHPISDNFTRFVIPTPFPEVSFDSKSKVEWINSYKPELRKLLQIWGTEFRRSQDPNYWVSGTKGEIEKSSPNFAFLSDMRFQNEASICDVTIRVVRTGYVESDPTVGAHISETEMDGFPFDFTIEARDVEELKRKGTTIFEHVLRKRREEKIATR